MREQLTTEDYLERLARAFDKVSAIGLEPIDKSKKLVNETNEFCGRFGGDFRNSQKKSQ